VLYDGETGTLHNRLRLQQTGASDDYGGFDNSNPSAERGWRLLCSLVEHPRGCSVRWADCWNHQPGVIQPAAIPPGERYITRTVNVTAPDAYLLRGQGRLRPTGNRCGGMDLQIVVRVQLEYYRWSGMWCVAPPGSGVLFSSSSTQQVGDPAGGDRADR